MKLYILKPDLEARGYNRKKNENQILSQESENIESALKETIEIFWYCGTEESKMSSLFEKFLIAKFV